MNEFLRDRILRKLDSLSDERLYQVLDYVDFLETKYAERPGQAQNVFQRFAESVEGKLRAGQVSATTVAETMKYMNKAMGVLTGVAAAGRSVASDFVDAARRQPNAPGTPGASGGPAPGTGAPPVTPTPTLDPSPTPMATSMPTQTSTPSPVADAGSGEQPL